VDEESPVEPVRLSTIAREWTRIGCIGFGGPPTHIALLRKLCVSDRCWISTGEFEDGIAATNLLPGPASTQLAIFCAWRLRGPLGALVGGICFIVPGLIYGIWRLAATKNVCAACLADALVPLDSTTGRAIANRAQPAMHTSGSFCGDCGAKVEGRFCAVCGAATGR